MKTSAIFIGKDGSMGFSKGTKYMLDIETRNNYIWATCRGIASVPYGSMTALVKNWQFDVSTYDNPCPSVSSCCLDNFERPDCFFCTNIHEQGWSYLGCSYKPSASFPDHCNGKDCPHYLDNRKARELIILMCGIKEK